MRKADYQTLAGIIARTRNDASRALEHGDERQRLVAQTIAQTAENIARDFARSAHVVPSAFLIACGVQP